jgi:hypothetical protein
MTAVKKIMCRLQNGYTTRLLVGSQVSSHVVGYAKRTQIPYACMRALCNPKPHSFLQLRIKISESGDLLFKLIFTNSNSEHDTIIEYHYITTLGSYYY